MFLIMVPHIFSDLLSLQENPADARLPNGVGYAKEVAVVPQRWINAYPPETTEKSAAMLHETYVEGDWMLSFNGCGILLGGPMCEQTLQKYHDASLLTI